MHLLLCSLCYGVETTLDVFFLHLYLMIAYQEWQLCSFFLCRYGFVQFANSEDAKAGLELNGKVVKGKTLKVDYAIDKSPNSKAVGNTEFTVVWYRRVIH